MMKWTTQGTLTKILAIEVAVIMEIVFFYEK